MIGVHKKSIIKKIVAAFRGMHASPAKYSDASVTDGQTDGETDDGQSYPHVSLCFAGDTKTRRYCDGNHYRAPAIVIYCTSD